MKISKKAIEEVRNLRLADEKRDYEKEMNEWFRNLTILQRSDFAFALWHNLSYEDKIEEYESREGD